MALIPILSRVGSGFGFAGGSRSVISATGGTTYTPGNGYKYHVFTYPNSDSFVADSSGTIDVLIVAGGGGGGGGYHTGGGGAGGVVYGPSVVITAGTYAINVGLGGTGSSGSTGLSGDGQPSSFGAVTALGGGGGASGPQPGGNDLVLGKSGGSAGGNGVYQTTGYNLASPQPVPSSYLAYGNPGGVSAVGVSSVTGGGGAGGIGGVPPFPDLGNIQLLRKGGAGQPFPGFAGPLIPILVPVVPRMGPTGDYYGGGGSGGNISSPPANGVNLPGGAGGGGGGTTEGVDPATPGETATGATHLGGGGGGRGHPGGGDTAAGDPGGPGGSGIVIIRYLI